MSDLNSEHNRVVWIDIPVADLDRANAFYAAVLGISVTPQQFEEFNFSVLEHKEGNGGCLVPMPNDVSDKGIIIYLNVAGRLRDAVAKTQKLGGKVLEPVHAIGPHGFRALILDSEGNRVALHSMTDA
jgi:predicted enzyme related to lactoylglutathione lyase